MSYGNAMLGETPELFQETAEWAAAELARIERNERAKRQIVENIFPLLEKKREKLICSHE